MLLQVIKKFLRCIGLAEVFADDKTFGLIILGELLAEFVESGFVAPREDDPKVVAGKQVGKVPANAAAGTGDENGLELCGHRLSS